MAEIYSISRERKKRQGAALMHGWAMKYTDNIVDMQQWLQTHPAMIQVTSYTQGEQIAWEFLRGREVKVYFSEAESTVTCRVLDFVSGVVYGMRGRIERLSPHSIFFRWGERESLENCLPPVKEQPKGWEEDVWISHHSG